ncbi:MAG: DUF371 domain-containing protein [Candidatus Methanomethylicaceae archaeon]
MFKVTFHAWGDPLITATHRTTLEVTKEGLKSKRGDCVVATRSEIGLRELPEEFKSAAKIEDARISLFIEVDGLSEEVQGRGHPSLSFESDKEMVVRKSGYVCGRTLMIYADKAAADLNREFVTKLKDKGARVRLTLVVH